MSIKIVKKNLVITIPVNKLKEMLEVQDVLASGEIKEEINVNIQPEVTTDTPVVSTSKTTGDTPVQQ